MIRIFIILLFAIYISGCKGEVVQNVDQMKVNCSVSDASMYPYGIMPLVYNEKNNIYILLKNAHPDRGVNLGSGFNQYTFKEISKKNNELEFCVAGVVDVHGSNLLVSEQGYKSRKIDLDDFIHASSPALNDGVYRFRFILVGSNTNWCKVKLKSGIFSGLTCSNI